MIDALRRRLQAAGQEHLIAHWDRLQAAERTRLAEQIEAIDFEQLRRLTSQVDAAKDWKSLAARAASPPAIRLSGSGNPYDVDEARRAGEELLRSGKVGAILVAGGQGTRLGFDHPKGMYAIGPVSGASLFQILIEKLVAVGRRYGATVPLFLMTSSATHDETVAYLESHDRFGLAKEDLVVFRQGSMPAVDEKTGDVLLSGPGEIALSPDGHGGLVEALGRSRAMEIIRRRGLRSLFYFQVDNPLAQVCDPEFIGYHELSRSQVSTQVVAKRDPAEKVGVVAAIDGRTQIIEYSDLPPADAERRGPDGSLDLWAGNIAVHVFDAEFLLGSGAAALPFHVARKKVPYVDAAGHVVEPATPNAIKFERFIFDLLPAAERTLVVEVDAARAFAPVKNGPGAERDSPEIVRRALLDEHRRWLTAAGAEVAHDVPVEISPTFAVDAQETARKVPPGAKFAAPTYLHETS